jgi:hypothetical protein
MANSIWLEWLKQFSRPRQVRGRQAPGRAALGRPMLEGLEDRMAPSVTTFFHITEHSGPHDYAQFIRNLQNPTVTSHHFAAAGAHTGASSLVLSLNHLSSHSLTGSFVHHLI